MNILYPHQNITSIDAHLFYFLQSLKPDPILSLRRIIGFGGCTTREVCFLQCCYLFFIYLHIH